MQPARLPRSEVARTYTWIAPTHDGLAVLVERDARRLALRWADVTDGETVLEVAVGTGLNLRPLLRQNPNGWTDAVDLTPAMLRRAARRAKRAPTDRYRLLRADAYNLPFDDDRYDLVVNTYMFDLLPSEDFVPVLREFRRVLRPGGRLAMANLTIGPRWYHRLWEGIYRLWPPLLGGCRGVRVAPALVDAGFTDVRRRVVSQWTFPSEVLLAHVPGPSTPP